MILSTDIPAECNMDFRLHYDKLIIQVNSNNSLEGILQSF